MTTDLFLIIPDSPPRPPAAATPPLKGEELFKNKKPAIAAGFEFCKSLINPSASQRFLYLFASLHFHAYLALSPHQSPYL